MISDIIYLALGLVLIIVGGNYVTDGAVAVSNKLKISPVVVGLTVVAFGSSTPDLVISVMSTVQGKTELAVGDIVGAGIFDMLLVIGITALLKPIKLSRCARWCDLPIMASGALILFLCTQDKWLDRSEFDILSRPDGIVLLILFAVFMFFTFSNARKPETMPDRAAAHVQSTASNSPKKQMAIWLAAICIVGGLAALVVGGNWIVDGASGIAKKAGWSEALIGLTIVAIGSSIPDLAASMMAALKHQQGLAMGNVLGAVIMDMLFVLGTCSLIHPLNTGNVTTIDFALLLGAALLVWLFGIIGKQKTITRSEGAILVILYICYMVYLVVSHA